MFSAPLCVFCGIAVTQSDALSLPALSLPKCRSGAHLSTSVTPLRDFQRA